MMFGGLTVSMHHQRRKYIYVCMHACTLEDYLFFFIHHAWYFIHYFLLVAAAVLLALSL